MIFSIYGRFELEVVLRDGAWQAYRRSNGIRQPDHDIAFPAGLEESDLPVFLDDLFHEYARPGEEVARLGA
jgi:hypothetical protein